MSCKDIKAPPYSGRMISVAAASLIKDESYVLLAQRPAHQKFGGLWELPGGKLEPDERFEDALIRELKEELGLTIGWGCLQPFTFISHAYDDFHLFMPVYAIRQWQGEMTPLVHQNLAWVRPQQMRDYPLVPADAPLIPLLHDYLKASS